MKRNNILCAAAAALASLAGGAHAHVTLEYQVAPAGSSYKATFKVSHGCAGAPTREISVQIPEGVRGARPMPKPGWNLTVERQKLAVPYDNHGRAVSEDVVRITWTAKTRADMLPHAWYDEFNLVGQLPATPGAIWWPVSQVCEEGRIDWTEMPRPGQKASELRQPAAQLEVLPHGGAGHQH